MKIKKVLIKGAYGTKNFGDDLLMIISHDIMKNHNFEVHLLAPKMRYIQKLIPNAKINCNNDNKKYDLLLYGGGTQFFHFEKGVNKNKVKLVKCIEKLVSLFFSPSRIKGAILRRIRKNIDIKNKAYLGVGLGPFNNYAVQKNILENFLNSKFIAVRDEKSKNYLENTGIKAILGSDLCFSSFFSKILKVQNANIEKVQLGIILRDWDKSESGVVSESQIKKLIAAIEKKNMSYRFLFFSEIHDKKWIRFCVKNNFRYIVWDPDEMSINHFMGVVHACKHIVSSRYHGLVLASLHNIPFTCLSIEDKISTFAKKFPFFNNVFFPFNLHTCIFDTQWPAEATKVVYSERQKADEMLLKFTEIIGNNDD